MLPAWFAPLALCSLLLGWVAVIATLVLMIKAKREQRLAAEARQAALEAQAPRPEAPVAAVAAEIG